VSKHFNEEIVSDQENAKKEDRTEQVIVLHGVAFHDGAQD